VGKGLPETVKKSEKAAQEERPPASREDPETKLAQALKDKEDAERKSIEYLDRLKRLQAEMENIQKIAKRQVETATKQASESIITKLLPTIDALQQAGDIAHSDSKLPPEEIAVGLRLLQNQLLDVLKSEGLHEIQTVGKPFDPDLHEAASYVETDERPENIIVEEIRKGYLLNGKVIRPSLVVVSRKKLAVKEQEDNTGTT